MRRPGEARLKNSTRRFSGAWDNSGDNGGGNAAEVTAPPPKLDAEGQLIPWDRWNFDACGLHARRGEGMSAGGDPTEWSGVEDEREDIDDDDGASSVHSSHSTRSDVSDA